MAGNILGTSGDVFLPLTTEWEEHSIEFVMPEGVETVTAVVVASRWDGVEVDYAFDNMFLMSMGVLDVIPPVAVEDIGAVPASYYNLVTWSDIAGEEGEHIMCMQALHQSQMSLIRRLMSLLQMC